MKIDTRGKIKGRTEPLLHINKKLLRKRLAERALKESHRKVVITNDKGDAYL